MGRSRIADGEAARTQRSDLRWQIEDDAPDTSETELGTPVPFLLRREVDDETVMRSNRLVVDSIEQSRIEAGEFVGVIETGRRHWEDFVELRDVVAGLKPGRTSPSDITFFKSLGLALEDVAIGKLVYERAVERGIGS